MNSNDMHVSGLKKEPTARDTSVFPAASVANTSISSRLDSSRTASTSHPDLMQVRQPAATPPRYGESAISRLAPKVAGVSPRLGSNSAAELRPGSDNVNNQRVMEWQMRNQMAKGVESAAQVPRLFDSEPSSTVTIGSEQRPNYVMSRPALTASPLPQSTSMPAVTDNIMASRGQTASSSVAEMSSVNMPVYSDNQRYKPPQLQMQTNQQFPAAVQSQMATVRPEMLRHPLPGMVPEGVQHLGPYVRSNVPDFRQQPPVTGVSMQYRPSGVTSPAAAISSEQRPNYYSSRPQSRLTESGYVASIPAKTASPLPQSTSVPVVTDNIVTSRGQMVANIGQQSPISTPLYSDDQRYKPQPLQTNMYSQQLATSMQPQFNQMANVRPQMSEIVRQPLPGTNPQDVRHPDPNIHSNLPGIHQQPAVIGNALQYRPTSGQYVVQGNTSNVVMAQSGVRYGVANVDGGMPAASAADGRLVYTPGVHYGLPDVNDRRPAATQGMQYEMASMENRAVPVGIPFSTDNRPYTAHEGPYGPPHIESSGPADIRYGMSNIAVRPAVQNVDANRKIPQAVVRYGMPNVSGEIPPAPPGVRPPAPPGVRYNSSSNQDRLAEAVPGSSHGAPGDQSVMKFSAQAVYYESPNTAAVSYSSPPYGIHSTSVVPADVRYEAGNPSNTGDNWPLPPSPGEHRGATNVQSEFSVPPSVTVPPPSSHLSAPHLQNTGDGSKPLPSEVRPRLQNIVTPVPGLPPGMPANNVRPKKQPPPIAAKPKLPVSTGVAIKTKEITTDEGKQLRPEKIQQKLLEMQRLESRPYLTANEQTKLQNLRVEVEFDKRLAGMSEKHDDDNDVPRMLPPAVRLRLIFSSYLSTYTS